MIFSVYKPARAKAHYLIRPEKTMNGQIVRTLLISISQLPPYLKYDCRYLIIYFPILPNLKAIYFVFPCFAFFLRGKECIALGNIVLEPGEVAGG